MIDDVVIVMEMIVVFLFVVDIAFLCHFRKTVMILSVVIVELAFVVYHYMNVVNLIVVDIDLLVHPQ